MMKSRCTRLLSTAVLGLAMAFCVASPAIAQAQPSTGAAPPPCFPLVNGTHTLGPRAVLGEHGIHVFWMCSPRVDQAAQEYGFSVPLAKIDQWHELNDAVAEISKASAKVGTAQRIYSEKIGYRCVDVAAERTSRGRMCRERQTVFDANIVKWRQE